jgi:hypothetical protein
VPAVDVADKVGHLHSVDADAAVEGAAWRSDLRASMSEILKAYRARSLPTDQSSFWIVSARSHKRERTYFWVT